MSYSKWPRAAEILDVPAFRPHYLTRGGQLQTIIGKITETEAPRAVERISIAFADGDQTYLEVDQPHDVLPSSPTVVMFHGLGGCSESGYLLRIARKLRELGIRVVRANHRGAGRLGGHLARRIYHAGCTDDLFTVLKVLEERYPNSPKVVVGFSLSGAITLNFVATHDLKQLTGLGVRGAMAVCCPLDLEKSSLSLARLSNRHYDIYFTRMLKRRALELHRLFPEQRYPNLPDKLNLRIFDEVFTAPVGGFRNRDHYYQSNSPLEKLSDIKLPTMILQAADDPVVPRAVYREVRKNDPVKLAVEPTGGHMGFLSHSLTQHGDRRWMDLAVISWCSKIFGNVS